MMKSRAKRGLAVLTAAVLCASSLAVCAEEASDEGTVSRVLSIWEDPMADSSEDAKPMLRFWFPDAGAGLTQEEIEELYEEGLTEYNEEYLQDVSQIVTETYEAGFGGLELTMLADSANYGTELVSEIGWGSEAWVRILCQALETANGLGEGDGSSFKIDITMTAHWPLIIDTVDPNDDEQQQELEYVIQAIDTDSLDGDVVLELPSQTVTDGKNGIFLFADKLVGVSVAKMKEEEVEVTMGFGDQMETVMQEQQTLDFESLTSIDFTEEEAYKAGVPEGDVIYQYTDERYYDLALAGTGDELGDPLKEGESICLYPSEDYYTFVDEENGGYIYIVDAETQEPIDADGLSYERTDVGTQMGPEITYTSEFAVTKDGEDISESVMVYYDSGVATNMSGALIADDGSSTPVDVRVNSTKDTFGIVTEEEATEDHPATERQYMDDVQSLYFVNGGDVQAAIEEIGDLEDGETYVLVPVYRRGSGQVSSGGGTITMDNRTYCISYYDTEGAQAVIDYWEDYMLDEPVDVYDDNGELVTVTLREMLAGNSAGSIFEDSLELNTSGSAWGAYMLDDFTEYAGYDVSDYLAVIAGVPVYNDENGTADDIEKDYEDVKEELFNDKHTAVISEWANGIGGGYRFQSGSDDARRSENVDIIEADNGSLSNVLKAIGTVNAKGDEDNPYLSMEAITSTSIDPVYYMTMMELNMNFVRGINRIVIHGIPFEKSLNGYINEWPGWVFGEPALDKGYGAWSSRQAFYNEESDIMTFTNYVTRIQGLLQETQEEVPIMIVGNAQDAELEYLRNNGYHYNETSEYGIMYDNMSEEYVEDGILHPEGMATQMIVLYNLGSEVGQYEFLERLNAYADAGMKIVIYGDTDISSLEGAGYGDYETLTDENQTDEYVQSLYAELLENENTITGISTEEDLLNVVKENVSSTISFETDGLEAVHMTEDDTDYYLFYNSALEEGYSPINYGGVGEDLDLTEVKGKDVTSEITLETDGAYLYSLDPYSGTITELNEYTDNGDGTVTLSLDIAAWDTAVLSVSEEEIAGAVSQHDKAGDPVLDLTDASWDLTIESYGPATDFDEDADFNETVISTLTFDDVSLGLWQDLNDKVTREELIEIGITDEVLEAAESEITGFGDKLLNGESLTVDGDAIQYVSGIGYYTTTFDWDEDAEGAVISFSHEDDSVESDARVNGDMITKVTITNENGTYEFTGINQISDKLDIGDVLVQGENTIEVKLVTSLRNREWIEGAATGPSYNSMHSYGLTGLTISVY